MKPQFSLVYLTAPSASPPEMIYMASRAGYDFVSLRTISMQLPNEPNFSLSRNKKLIDLTKRALQDTGVKIHDTENARIYDEADIASYEPEIEVAAELGARYILSNIWTTNSNITVNKLGQLCEIAASYGLSIIVEFVTWSAVKTLHAACELIRQTGKQNVGLVIDTLHFNRSQCRLEDFDAVPSDLLKFAHLCDAPREIPKTTEGLIHAGRVERNYLGEGAIDIASIVRKMPPMVYGIEIPHLERISEIGVAEHVFRSLEHTKKYFEHHCL